VVELCVGSARPDSDPIDIACDGVSAPQAGRCDCQNSGAGADIEDSPWLPPLCEIAEREQAAKRRAVMTGAEGEGGLDLNADVVGS